MNVDAPLVYAGTPIRMPGNEIRGFRKGGVLEDIEACNAPLRTRLDYRVAQLSSPDKLGTFQNQRIGLGRHKQPAAVVIGNMCLAHGSAHIHDCAIDGFGGKGRGITECGCLSLQNGRGILFDLQRHAVCRRIEPVSNQVIGDGCSVKTVNDLIHGLVLVNGDINVRGIAMGSAGAVGFAVIRHGYFGVPNRDLYLASLGIAFVTVIENYTVLFHQRRAQLRVHQFRITVLKFVCHCSNLLLQFEVRIESGEGRSYAVRRFGTAALSVFRAGIDVYAGAVILFCGVGFEKPRVGFFQSFQLVVKSQQLVAVQLYSVQIKQSACGFAVFRLAVGERDVDGAGLAHGRDIGVVFGL
nr:MAG TPA: hypothetical protein [Caudoviricetes sp.]